MSSSADAAPASSTGVSYYTLRELVQSQIVRDIVAGFFVPGERLLEAELAERYGVSRGPIREALRALEAQGLVRSVRNRGFLVTRLTRPELREVYEIRAEIEGLASALSAPEFTDADVAQMQQLLRKMSLSHKNPPAWIQLNEAFHELYYSRCGRPRLLALISDFVAMSAPYSGAYLEYPGVIASIEPQHRAMVDAAERRDPVAARDAASDHIMTSNELLLPVTEGGPTAEPAALFSDEIVALGPVAPASPRHREERASDPS